MKCLARPILIAALLGMLAIPGQVAAAHGRPASAPIRPWRFGSPPASRFQRHSTSSAPIGTDPTLPPTTLVGGNPVDVAVDDLTHTAYVSNGNDAAVSIVDTTHCRAGDTSGCQQRWPTIPVGNGPVSLAVNQTTNTIYVTNIADNTVSVIDGTTCNAATQTGCRAAPPAVNVGPGPDYVAIDEVTNTIYIANNNNGGPDPGSVSVINGNLCDAAHLAGCRTLSPPTVPVGVNPIGLVFDADNRTVYVANAGDGDPSAGTVSMIDTTTCTATNTTGCPVAAPTVAAMGAAWVDVDLSTDTLYVSGFGPSLGSVSIIDGATCNGRITAGCSTRLPVVVAGSGPIGIVVDQQTHNVFVSNQEDSTVSVIDGTNCNASVTRGCDQTPLSVGVGFDTATPGLDPSTQTLYVPSQDLNTVSVVAATACTATRRSGCRRAAPTTTVGNGPQGITTDPSTGTLYVTNQDDSTLTLINATQCNAAQLSGCNHAWPTVPVGSTPKFIMLDHTTHTGYIADVGDGIVWAFDVAHCNATTPTGCVFHPITISSTPDYLDWMVIDEANHSLYVTDRNANGLAIVDTSSCNAGNFTGCSGSPRFASLGSGSGPDGVVLDPASQTLYVADTGIGAVSVLDASTCNAQVAAGCSGSHPTVPVDSRPTRIALDQRTDTIFVASKATDRVNVIDGRSCNARTSSGCAAPGATITVSLPNAGEVAHPITIVVDESTDLIYLSDVVDSAIVVLNGATCNGQNTAGCSRRIGNLIRTGGWPSNVVLDPSLGTGYNPDNVDGQVSVFRLLN